MIRHARQALNLTQAELAQLAGITVRCLQEAEAQTTAPRTATLLEIVRGLRAAYEAAPPPLPNRHLDAMVRDFINNPLGLPQFDTDPTPPPKGGKPAARPRCAIKVTGSLIHKHTASGVVAKIKEANNEKDESGASEANSGSQHQVTLQGNCAALGSDQFTVPFRDVANHDARPVPGKSGGYRHSDLLRTEAAAEEAQDTQALEDRLHPFCVLSDDLNKFINGPKATVAILSIYASQFENAQLLALNPVDMDRWARVFYGYKKEWRGLQLFRRAMIDCIREHPQLGRPAKTKISQDLCVSRKKLKLDAARSRATDEENNANWNRVLDDIYGAVRREDRDCPHSKGAYQERAHMDDSPKFKRVWLGMAEQTKKILGVETLPSFATFSNRRRARFGKSDKIAIIHQHHMRTRGFRVNFGGELWEIDGTGYPAEVSNCIGTRDKNGKLSHNIFIRCDVMTAQTQHFWLPGKSETEGWEEALFHFLRESKYSPRWALSDRISKLFNDIHNLTPGKLKKFNIGVLLYLAADIAPYVHTAEVKTGKAHGERAVRTFKSKASGMALSEQIFRTMAGTSKKYYRHFESPAQFQRFLDSVEFEINNSKLNRRSNFRTRNQLMDEHAEAVAWRETRALKDDWEQIFTQDVLPHVRIVRVCGGSLSWKENGQHREIFLRADKVPMDARECNALVMPARVLKRDTNPNAVRIAMPTTIQGQARYTVFEQEIEIENFYGKLESQPLFLEESPKALMETMGDVQARNRDEAIRLARKAKLLAGVGTRKFKQAIEETPDGALLAVQQQSIA